MPLVFQSTALSIEMASGNSILKVDPKTAFGNLTFKFDPKTEEQPGSSGQKGSLILTDTVRLGGFKVKRKLVSNFTLVISGI